MVAALERRWVDAVLLLAIALGVVLRFDGLERRPLWYDEVATMLRLSGATEGDLLTLYDGRALDPHTLLRRFQQTSDAPLGRGVVQSVRSVAVDEPQLGAGYLATASVWTRAAGGDRGALRALSALLSVAALALLGVLAWRLFGDRHVALACVALAAVSPLQVRYAQEARAYALWQVFLLATAVAVYAAARQPSRTRWTLVALAFAAALHVHPLTVLSAPALLLLARGAAATPATTARRSATRRVPGALAAGLVLWAPWVIVGALHQDASQRTTAWAGDDVGAAALLRAWLGIATAVFFRPGGAGGLLDGLHGALAAAAWVALGGGAALLIVLALVKVARRAAEGPRSFVLALALVPFATLALADLALGGRRSTVDRYLLPGWIALELAVAFLLASPGPRRAARHAILIVVLALGATTLLRSRPLDVWWNTDPSGLAALRAVEVRLDTTPASVVLTDAPPIRALELSRRLDDGASLRLGNEAPRQLTPDDWSRALLAWPSPALRAATERALPPQRVLVRNADGLEVWHVEPRS